MNVFIDSSAFYALVDAADANHRAAVTVWQSLLRQNEPLVTSNYVITEMVALLHHRFGTDVVRRFVTDNLPVVQVHWVEQSLHDSALGAMLAITSKSGPSLTDCTSLELMRRLDIRRVFAYDRHFENLGLTVLK